MPANGKTGIIYPEDISIILLFSLEVLLLVVFMGEIEKILWNFPLFKTCGEKERFFKVLGLLVSHQITLEKAAELLELDVEKLIFILDLLEIDYSFLDEEETRLEKEAVEKLLDQFKNGNSA